MRNNCTVQLRHLKSKWGSTEMLTKKSCDPQALLMVTCSHVTLSHLDCHMLSSPLDSAVAAASRMLELWAREGWEDGVEMEQREQETGEKQGVP